MSDNITVLIVQILAGAATVFGVWYANRAQDKRDDRRREEDDEANAIKQRVDTQRLKADIEKDFWSGVHTDMNTERDKRIRLENKLDGVRNELDSLRNELNETIAKHTIDMQKLIDSYEERIAAMEKSFEERDDEKDIIINSLSKRVDELEKQVKAIEDEKLAISVERDEWKARALKAESGKGKMGL